MSEKTKEVYSLLQDIFKNVWEQQKYSEVKNGVLLTLNIAIFAIIARVYFSIASSVSNEIYSKVIFFILMVFFIIHLIFIIQSFFPKDSNKEDFKWTNNEINIFFFGDIQKLDSPKYLDLVIEKISIDKSDITKEPLLDLSNQIIKLSEITQSKYTSFKASIIRMYWISGFFFIYFTYIYFT